jgi:uncharacterized protein YbjT (DUF2867 family)
MDKTLNVALLGATGLVGRELVQVLLNDPAFARVTVLARRATGTSHAKLDEQVIDLDAMTAAHFAGVDQIFCALGTTMRTAGSEEKFRHVDHDLPMLAAKRGLEAGAHHYLLVSALGAKRNSRFFYNRVKGDVEANLLALGYRGVTIARPSLLLGARDEFRLGERLAARVGWLMPLRTKPIAARNVATALVNAAREDAPGVRVLESKDMQR